MSLDFDNIIVKVDNRVVQLGTSEIPMIALFTTSWEEIPDKPETFPPSEHNHDDRYYTESEIDTKLAGKADEIHNHDDRYYTEAETDTFLAGKADAEHDHDDRYYTKAEENSLLREKADVITITSRDDFVSFSDGSGTSVDDFTVLIDPVQSGSGDPTPENVRPITGWTSGNVAHTGKNLLYITGLRTNYTGMSAVQNADGSITVSGTPTRTYFDMNDFCFGAMKAGTYTISINKALPYNFYIRFQYDDGTYANAFISAGETKAVFVLGKDAPKYRLVISGMTIGTEYTAETFYAQFERGDQATEYVSYHGAYYDYPWESLAGTVYGGALDIRTGILTVTSVSKTVTSAINFNTSNYIARVVEGAKPGSAKVFYSYLKTVNKQNPAAGEGTISSTGGRLLIKLAGITTAADCNAYLAANPLQVVYELATPLTYQLTSAEINTFLGENAFWANTGQVSVTYKADTKLYVDQKIAESATATRRMIADIANGDLAPKSLASGDLIIVGDELRKATDNIGQGSAITASNSTTATLADVIKALQ